MGDQYITNNISVGGSRNVVDFSQTIQADSNEAMLQVVGLMLKFCLTLLLAPIAIPFLLYVNRHQLIDKEPYDQR